MNTRKTPPRMAKSPSTANCSMREMSSFCQICLPSGAKTVAFSPSTPSPRKQTPNSFVNDDEDYLPGGSQLSGASFIPGETTGWSLLINRDQLRPASTVTA